MIKNIDLSKKDSLAKPLKAMKDEEKIKEFFNNRQAYYKKMSPKKGVFKTSEDAATPTKGHFGVTSVKVKAKATENSEEKKEKQHEDLLYDFSSATQTAVPLMQQRQEEIRKALAKRA